MIVYAPTATPSAALYAETIHELHEGMTRLVGLIPEDLKAQPYAKEELVVPALGNIAIEGSVHISPYLDPNLIMGSGGETENSHVIEITDDTSTSINALVARQLADERDANEEIRLPQEEVKRLTGLALAALKDAVILFYTKFNPKNVDSAISNVEKNIGKETELLMALEARYTTKIPSYVHIIARLAQKSLEYGSIWERLLVEGKLLYF